jgi:hypothetical protein
MDPDKVDPGQGPDKVDPSPVGSSMEPCHRVAEELLKKLADAIISAPQILELSFRCAQQTHCKLNLSLATCLEIESREKAVGWISTDTSHAHLLAAVEPGLCVTRSLWSSSASWRPTLTEIASMA